MRSCFHKLGLFLSAVVVFVVASACCADQEGITALGVDSDYRVVAGYAYTGDVGSLVAGVPQYASNDGGLTWQPVDPNLELRTDWAGKEVETPRGVYQIEGAGVYLLESGTRTKVYSVEHLNTDSNRWAQLDSLRRGDCEEPTTAPLGISYHQISGNVVLAMGDVGAVVGNPDGEWIEVQVGDYAPVDYSYTAKLGRLWAQWFWLSALATALLFTVLAAVVSLSWGPGILLDLAFGIIICLVALVAMAAMMLIGVFLLPYEIFGIDSTLFPAFLSLGLFWLVSLLALRAPRGNELRKGMGFSNLLFGLILYWLCNFGVFRVDFFSGISGLPGLVIGVSGEFAIGISLASLQILLSIVAAVLLCQRGYWLAVGLVCVAVYLVFAVSYLLWLNDVLPSLLLTLNPALPVLIGFAIYLRQRAKQVPAGEPSQNQLN